MSQLHSQKIIKFFGKYQKLRKPLDGHRPPNTRYLHRNFMCFVDPEKLHWQKSHSQPVSPIWRLGASAALRQKGQRCLLYSYTQCQSSWRYRFTRPYHQSVYINHSTQNQASISPVSTQNPASILLDISQSVTVVDVQVVGGASGLLPQSKHLEIWNETQLHIHLRVSLSEPCRHYPWIPATVWNEDIWKAVQKHTVNSIASFINVINLVGHFLRN